MRHVHAVVILATLFGSAAAGQETSSTAGRDLTSRSRSLKDSTPATSSGIIPVWLGASSFASSVMYQAATGNIGVGTRSPAAKLDVNGSINSSSSYKIGGFDILSTPGSYNLFVGQQAGGSDTTGSYNLFLGLQAGSANTRGSFNTFSGISSGESNVAGSNNSFFGFGAGGASSSGSNNTFIGMQAGSGNPNSGSWNTFVGMSAGTFNTSGAFNTFFGGAAGYGNTTGLNNVFVGHMTGPNNTGGSDNTFSGYNAGFTNTSGQLNAFYGYQAGYNNLTGSGDIYISNPGPTSGTESNAIRIGDTNQTAAFIAGIYGAASPSGVQVYVNSNGQLGTQSSSLRFKEGIQDMGDSSGNLFKLRPVTFSYKPKYDDGSHALQYGLIAEEVAKIYPEMVVYDRDGQPYTVKYQYLAPMLLNELHKQRNIVAEQHEQITDLQQRLSRLESFIANKQER